MAAPHVAGVIALVQQAAHATHGRWLTPLEVRNLLQNTARPMPGYQHYSVGAGTTLALEDAIALAAALREHSALPQALARYERERKAALLPVQSAARYSAQWYENLPRYVRLPPERMFALLGQRHSPLLPHVPPQLYYRLDRAAGQLEPLRRFKRWLGPKVARTVHARAVAAREQAPG
jgi:hypothetical protein